jgi:hypothetical protein
LGVHGAENVKNLWFRVRKEKVIALIKRVKLTQEFQETLEVAF